MKDLGLLVLLCLSLWGCSGGQTVTVMAPEPERKQAPARRPAQDEKQEATRQLVRSVWTRLGQTHNACPEQFDYHPEGGLLIFSCHLQSLEPFTRLGELFGGAIYISGPHSNQGLVLNARQDFGHYNPRFVDWLVEHAVPAARDPAFRELTQPLYNEYARPLVNIFAVTWEKLRGEPACHQMLRDEYEGLLQQKKLPDYYYEKFFFFMNPKFCGHANAGFSFFSNNGFDGGVDGNVVKSAVAFWLRRSMDGTAERFAQGVQLLRDTYESSP